MIFRNRALAYAGAGAAGILAAGLLAAPALASTAADLAIEATGTTIAVGAPGKTATVSLINKSDADATGILVGLDISKLDTNLVDIDENGCSPREDGLILCGIEGDTLGAGEDVDWGFPLTRKGSGTGEAGELTAVILHDGEDPDLSNNEVTVKVTVEGTGPDLAVVADDVRHEVKVEGGAITPVGDLHAGGTGALLYSGFNQGDLAAGGLRISVQLPAGVTFAEKEEDCEYNAGMTELTCQYDDLVLVPAAQDTNTEDEIFSGARFYNLVKVDAGVAAKSLTGGQVQIEAVSVRQPEVGSKGAVTSSLPGNAVGLSAADVDPTDNVDDFAVIVAAKGGAGGGDGDGPGLPVTGPQAGLIGGIGVAVLLAGGVMFLVARRRRVVLVSPGDEKPAA